MTKPPAAFLEIKDIIIVLLLRNMQKAQVMQLFSAVGYVHDQLACL